MGLRQDYLLDRMHHQQLLIGIIGPNDTEMQDDGDNASPTLLCKTESYILDYGWLLHSIAFFEI